MRFVAIGLLLVARVSSGQEAPVDQDWKSNATLRNAKVMTLQDLGVAQGVSLHEGKLYLYGDVHDAKPRVGVVREYDLELKPTGRSICLTKNNKPLLVHPTGLTWDAGFGCFLGDTVNKKAKLYAIDWQRALADGNLNRAVLNTIDDDLAINGCRPIFVTVAHRTMLATADYGNVRPAIRLYDVEKLGKAKRSSAPGVLVHQILCGAFNQNLAWDAEKGQLTCIQNVVAGLGWQLDVLNLEKGIADGRADGPGVRVRKLTLPSHTELEGYLPLDQRRGMFITSYSEGNVVIGEIASTPPTLSPAGMNPFVDPQSKGAGSK